MKITLNDKLFTKKKGKNCLPKNEFNHVYKDIENTRITKLALRVGKALGQILISHLANFFNHTKRSA